VANYYFKSIKSICFATILTFIFQTNLKAQDSIYHRSINDTIANRILNETIVTANKPKDQILPILSIVHTQNLLSLKENSNSIFEGIDHQPEVQLLTPSLGFKVINTRGFSNTTNVRFTQIVDGMDVQSPHIWQPYRSCSWP
jgi:hypothetical protein